MSEVRLSTKDADSILSYIRDQLEEENNEWKEYLENRDDLVKHMQENPIFKICLSEEDIATAYKNNEDIHQEIVNKLMGFIELLTVGSEV